MAYTDFELEVFLGTDREFEFTIDDGSARLSLTGAPTGGTFPLGWRGHTTAAIAYNASAAAVQAALASLENIDAADVLCSGGPLPATPVVINFQGHLLGQHPAGILASGANLTGGVSPDAEITRVAKNITGWTFWMTGKRSLGAADPGDFQLTTAGGGIVAVDLVNGKAKAVITPTTLAALAYRKHTLYVDLKTNDGSKKHILMSGLFYVAPPSTRT